MAGTPLCNSCPVRGLTCPAAYDPRYCRLAAWNPDRYRPVILWRARALAGAAGRLPPPLAYAGTTRAALLLADLGEDDGLWLEGLIRQSDPGRVAWTGLAFTGEGRPEAGPARALADLVPLHGGPSPALDLLDVGQVVRRHGDAAAAVRQACHGAEVLVAVGAPGWDRLTAGLGLPVVAVTTGSGAGRLSPGADSGPAARHVVLGPGPSGSLGPDPGRDAVVIPAGVMVERCVPRLGRVPQRASWGLDDRHVAVGLVARSWSWEALRVVALASGLLGERGRLVVIDASRAAAGSGLCGTPAWDGLGPVTVVPPGAHRGDVLAALDVFLAAPATGRADLTPGLVEAWLAGVPTVAVSAATVAAWEPGYGILAVPVPGEPSPAALAAGIRAALGTPGRAAAARARAMAWERLTAGATAELWAGLLAAAAQSATAWGRPPVVGGTHR